MAETLLKVDNISKSFRGLKAVGEVSFDVPKGTVLALIGPNGAGKTTIFNLIAGVMRPDEGRIELDGADITGYSPHRACHEGIGRTFQIVKPFRGLSVEDNVTVGALRAFPDRDRASAEAGRVLRLLGLDPKAHLPAESLTLPDRKRLEVARALATRPKILLLDEVMAGLRPTEVDGMVATFAALVRETGLTILLIEHVMRAVMALSERVVVVSYGRKIAEGTPAEVSKDPKVLECYLGEGAAL